MGDRMKRWLAEWTHRAIAQLVPVQTLDAALGDLAEEYALHAQDTSTLRAWGWYCGQFVRSMPRMMWIDIRRGRVVTVAAAVGAWVVASVVEGLANQAIVAWFGSDAPLRSLPGVVVGLAAMTLGGYVAALIRPGAPKVLAAITGLVVIALMIADSQRVPLWFAVVFLIFGPVVSIAGGAWRKTLS
jgi:hypothetical protein